MKIGFDEMRDFLNAYPKISDNDYPFITAYKLSKIQQILSNEVEFFDKALKSILNKYAKIEEDGTYVMSEDGSSVMIQEDKLEECSSKLEELMNVKIDIEDIYFDANDFAGLTLRPSEIAPLLPFIK